MYTARCRLKNWKPASNGGVFVYSFAILLHTSLLYFAAAALQCDNPRRLASFSSLKNEAKRRQAWWHSFAYQLKTVVWIITEGNQSGTTILRSMDD